MTPTSPTDLSNEDFDRYALGGQRGAGALMSSSDPSYAFVPKGMSFEESMAGQVYRTAKKNWKPVIKAAGQYKVSSFQSDSDSAGGRRGTTYYVFDDNSVLSFPN